MSMMCFPFHHVSMHNKHLIGAPLCYGMIVAVKGGHNTGKTHLIEEMVGRFSDRSVVVIKLSGKDAIDVSEKDTHRYRVAGAPVSIIVTKSETVLFSQRNNPAEALLLAQKCMPDIIIVEGYEHIEEVPYTILIDMDTGIDMEEVYEEMAEELEKERNDIAIFIDGHAVPLNAFTQELFHATISAMLSTLKGGDGTHLELFIRKEERKHI